MKLESIILNDFFEILNKIEANYCVMNNYTNMPEVIPTDVDFAIDVNTFNSLDNLIKFLAKKHNVSITQKIWHGYNKCAYILSPLKTDRYFWLQLDFFVDFCAQGFPNLIPIGQMLQYKKPYKNFFVPIPEIEFPFVIQRRIIKGDLKLQHLNTLNNLYSKSEHTVSSSLNEMFGVESSEVLINIIKEKNINHFNENHTYFRDQLKKVSNNNVNFNYRIKYYFNQLKRALYRLYYPTGISISIIGDDLELQKEYIRKIESRVSGSFHGTKYNVFDSYPTYFKTFMFSVFWPKITKKTVYINLSIKDKPWQKFFLNRIIKIIGMKPDVILLFNYKDKHIISDTYQILKFQADKTERHLNSRFSQTSGSKFKNYKEC